MAAREKEALIENAIKESNTISEECKQELLKYYQKKKLYMKNGVFSLEGDKKTYEDMIFELQDENQTLKDNNKNMQEEMIRTWEKTISIINSIHYDELHHYKVMRDIMDILKDEDERFIQTYDKLEEYIKKELEKYE